MIMNENGWDLGNWRNTKTLHKHVENEKQRSRELNRVTSIKPKSLIKEEKKELSKSHVAAERPIVKEVCN